MANAKEAGEKMGEAILMMVDLMYQNDTAIRFLETICGILLAERTKRALEKLQKFHDKVK